MAMEGGCVMERSCAVARGKDTSNKFVTFSLLKRSRDGRFISEAAVRWFQKSNRHLDPEVV
jgi:hypothetical protein